MWLVVLLYAAVSLSAGGTIPLVPRNNSHYVEGVSRYIWMPDGEGVLHLVDLQEPVPEAALNQRSDSGNEYWLFTRRNRRNHQVITNNNLNSLRNSNYDGSKPTIAIVHGFASKGTSSLNPLITAEYLNLIDGNVIVVDWSKVALGSYTLAVRGVPGVGRDFGNFLMWLVRNGGGNWNNIHLVGFSLGAHVVGNAGRTTRQEGRNCGRVTGLDPAGPQWGSNSNRLHRNDGSYVEVIHTDGTHLGIHDPIGNADFYPNGGIHPQPGCIISACSHSRAYDIFAATVKYNHLSGRRCAHLDEMRFNRCSGVSLNMGNAIHSKRGTGGIYRLNTGNSWPF